MAYCLLSVSVCNGENDYHETRTSNQSVSLRVGAGKLQGRMQGNVGGYDVKKYIRFTVRYIPSGRVSYEVRVAKFSRIHRGAISLTTIVPSQRWGMH